VHLQETKIRKISFGIALSFIIIMGLVFLADYLLHLNLYKFGVLPRNFSGLIGIITSPFIHSTQGYEHLFNNSIPMLVLTWLLFYSYRTIATQVFTIIYLATGLLVWFFARENYHIGMSGVIYGLTAFLIISGFFRKDIRIAGISLLVIFLYGSLIWGIFPQDPSISWEGHFFGFASGGILAVIYRNKGPQPQKYRYEIEDELGYEYEEEFWLEKPESNLEEAQQAVNEQRYFVNYTFIPKETKVVNPPEQHLEKE
jgi:membrane associated rhomboid family serine protease